jgi:hypothetical protein
MTYKVNLKTTILEGTSFKGTVYTTYDELVSKFGEPRGPSADNKVKAEWIIEGEDGTVATIYDWKLDNIPKDLYHWHVGGSTHKALDLVEEVLGVPTIAFVF